MVLVGPGLIRLEEDFITLGAGIEPDREKDHEVSFLGARGVVRSNCITTPTFRIQCAGCETLPLHMGYGFLRGFSALTRGSMIRGRRGTGFRSRRRIVYVAER